MLTQTEWITLNVTTNGSCNITYYGDFISLGIVDILICTRYHPNWFGSGIHNVSNASEIIN